MVNQVNYGMRNNVAMHSGNTDDYGEVFLLSHRCRPFGLHLLYLGLKTADDPILTVKNDGKKRRIPALAVGLKSTPLFMGGIFMAGGTNCK
ncbi:MAG: hypothetical protein PHQ27_05110 [Victivallales bacterium]|nr:hypothetical protein [Victivallales bacterium]